MSTEQIDHYAEARSRVATQYRESAKFLATLKALCTHAQELEQALLSVKDITDIDLSSGVQLDVIGDIVGVSRTIQDAVTLPFFGFEGIPGAMRFGETGSTSIGARFAEEGEKYTASTSLADPEYRTLIRAKIVKNHATGTVDDILEGLSYLFPGSINFVEDNGGMHIGVAIGKALSDVEKIMVKQLDILPRPAGVSVQWYLAFDSEFLGFSDQPAAVGFAEEGSTDGGFLAEEF